MSKLSKLYKAVGRSQQSPEEGYSFATNYWYCRKCCNYVDDSDFCYHCNDTGFLRPKGDNTLNWTKIQQIDFDLPLPSYKTPGSSGMDLHSSEDLIIGSGDMVKVRTGVAVSLPKGYEGQVRPRSSMGAQGIIIPNSPGTVDNDYRGEISVLLMNLSKDTVYISKGDRIAQLVIVPFEQTKLKEVNELDPTFRGAGGFGSTGK